MEALGIEACQAQHLLELTGGAPIALQKALLSEALDAEDLRWRLVRRHGSLAKALEAGEEVGKAPRTELEDLWRRMAAEWPQVLEAARCRRLKELGEALKELLPHFPEDFEVLYLDQRSFRALCEPLDVSEEDAERLFESITESLPCPEPRLFLDDVAEQLLLWTLGDRRSLRPLEKIKQLVAPARAAISALKAELQAPKEEKEEVEEVKELSLKPKKRYPRLPWLDHYSLRPKPLPMALR